VSRPLEIAHRIVATIGFDPGDGRSGCHWAAVRQADDYFTSSPPWCARTAAAPMTCAPASAPRPNAA